MRPPAIPLSASARAVLAAAGVLGLTPEHVLAGGRGHILAWGIAQRALAMRGVLGGNAFVRITGLDHFSLYNSATPSKIERYPQRRIALNAALRAIDEVLSSLQARPVAAAPEKSPETRCAPALLDGQTHPARGPSPSLLGGSEGENAYPAEPFGQRLPAPPARGDDQAKDGSPPPAPRPSRRGLEPDRAISQADRDLIAQALAAGRVTQCRPGHALGLTRLESQFGTVGRGMSPEALTAQAERSRRARGLAPVLVAAPQAPGGVP